MDGPALLTADDAPHVPHAAHGYPRAGAGHLDFAVVAGRTRPVRTYATSPLKILTPDTPDHPSAAAYLSTFGGGLLAGDDVTVDVRLDPRAHAFISTQSATKVFRAPLDAAPARQALRSTVADDALLVWWPDPLIPFAAARYHQHQHVDLAPTASLVLVDALTSGRYARDERWAFESYESRNTIDVDDRRALTDALLLDAADGSLTTVARGGRFNAFATAILIGPTVEPHFSTLERAVHAMPVTRRAPMLGTASRTPRALVVRLLGDGPEHVALTLRRLLAFVPNLLGHDPWSRKW